MAWCYSKMKVTVNNMGNKSTLEINRYPSFLKFVCIQNFYSSGEQYCEQMVRRTHLCLHLNSIFGFISGTISKISTIFDHAILNVARYKAQSNNAKLKIHCCICTGPACVHNLSNRYFYY